MPKISVASRAIQHFKIENAIYRELADDEVDILPLLLKAGELIEKIYLVQEKGHEENFGSTFYPKDASDDELRKAESENSQIFSPYTVVTRQNGKLEVIPYHVKYRPILNKVSALLKKASKASKNTSFSNYLRVASQSLLSGDYKKMDLAWLNTQDSTLQFLIGPYERYLDKRFFKKMAYLSYVGIKDPVYTRKIKEISEVLATSLSDKPHRYTMLSKVQVCSVRNILFSGYVARALLSTEHFPSDDETIREAGSRLICYLSTMDYKFNTYLYPIFLKIFETSFRASYSEDLLKHANYYLMFVYGLARQLHRYEGARNRLGALYPVFDEANSIVSGIQHCKHLIMKGVIDQKELEAMIIMHICWGFSEWIFAKVSKIRSDYLRGDALTLNFYLQHGALREIDGISWPNFSKIFFAIENLSTILVRLLAEGSFDDAQDFLKGNLSYEVFRTFDSKLTKIV